MLNSTFGSDNLKVHASKTLYQGFFKLIGYEFSHKKFDGAWSKPVQRELLERGDAVAVLAYDPKLDQVVLVEQIRVGALKDKSPWQLEIIAGMIEENESIEDVAIREAQEEAGVCISNLKSICQFYPSSGGSDEKIHLFIGCVDSSKAVGIHGVATEQEDILVHVVSREEAFSGISQGKIENASTIIALQWLALNYQTLQLTWSE